MSLVAASGNAPILEDLAQLRLQTFNRIASSGGGSIPIISAGTILGRFGSLAAATVLQPS